MKIFNENNDELKLKLAGICSSVKSIFKKNVQKEPRHQVPHSHELTPSDD